MSESAAETALETIRALELERAQLIEDEQARAATAVSEAHRDARRAVRAARDRGARAAERSYGERVAEAVAEAERIEVETTARAEQLLRVLRPRFAGMVDQMLEASKESGAFLMPSLNFRFTPNYVKAKELIDAGELGSVKAIIYREWIPAADLAMQWPPGAWVWNLEETGGPLFTLSVWSIDLMRWLLNADFESVDAAVEHFPIEKLGGTLGYNAFVNYRFPDGVIGCLQSSGSVAHTCSTSWLEVVGDNTHSLKANWNNELTLFAEEPGKSEWLFREGGGHRTWGHMMMDEHFVDCIREGHQPSIPMEDGRRAVEISLKIVGKA